MGTKSTNGREAYQCPSCGNTDCQIRQHESFRLHVFEECVCESCGKTWYPDRAGWTGIHIGAILLLPAVWGCIHFLTDGPVIDSLATSIVTWPLLVIAGCAGVWFVRFGILVLSEASSYSVLLPQTAVERAAESRAPEEWNWFIPKPWREPLAAATYCIVVVLLVVTGNWPKDENGQLAPIPNWKGRPIRLAPAPRPPQVKVNWPPLDGNNPARAEDRSTDTARKEEQQKAQAEGEKLFRELLRQPATSDRSGPPGTK